MSIAKRYRQLRKEIPEHVTIVLAAKMRTPEEIKEAIETGATDIGENYVQETERIYNALDEETRSKVKWHMIGNLQKNKINKAIPLFDVIETVDSVEKALSINNRLEKFSKIMPVYVEINIGSEISKSGIPPDYETVEDLAKQICKMKNLKLEGIMTMGPRFGDPEKSRLYFRKTKEIFDILITKNFKNVCLKYLSMGMSNSYKVAIEEGSNMVRLGTIIFGERCQK